eukprot:g6418.t1
MAKRKCTVVNLGQDSGKKRRPSSAKGRKTKKGKGKKPPRRKTREGMKKGRGPIALAVKAGCMNHKEESYYFGQWHGEKKYPFKKFWIYFTQDGYAVATGNTSTVRKLGEPESEREMDKDLVAYLKKYHQQYEHEEPETRNSDELHKFGSLSGLTRELVNYHKGKGVPSKPGEGVPSKPGWDKVKNENGGTARDALMKTLESAHWKNDEEAKNILSRYFKRSLSKFEVSALESSALAIQTEASDLLVASPDDDLSTASPRDFGPSLEDNTTFSDFFSIEQDTMLQLYNDNDATAEESTMFHFDSELPLPTTRNNSLDLLLPSGFDERSLSSSGNSLFLGLGDSL